MGDADLVRGVRRLTGRRAVRLIVFDLDGTLIDSRRDLAAAANATLVSAGAAPLEEEAVGRMVGEGAAVLVARAFEAAGVPQPADALARFLSTYDTMLLVHTRPYDGVIETLRILSADLPLSVLTNKPLDATRAILRGLELEPYFASEAVIGGDGPFPRKPDPAGINHLCAMRGVAVGDALLVGDSAIDARTGQGAGVRVCLARYGFGFASVSACDLSRADGVIGRPMELVSLYERNTSS